MSFQSRLRSLSHYFTLNHLNANHVCSYNPSSYSHQTFEKSYWRNILTDCTLRQTRKWRDRKEKTSSFCTTVSSMASSSSPSSLLSSISSMTSALASATSSRSGRLDVTELTKGCCGHKKQEERWMLPISQTKFAEWSVLKKEDTCLTKKTNFLFFTPVFNLKKSYSEHKLRACCKETGCYLYKEDSKAWCDKITTKRNHEAIA